MILFFLFHLYEVIKRKQFAFINYDIYSWSALSVCFNTCVTSFSVGF